jgi:SAM-dependent methyltransferase
MTVDEATVDHGRALLYHQSRPPYPAAVVDFVVEHTEPWALAVVADVGCGTGLSTLPFRRLAGTLIGIEPDPAMRTVAEEKLTVHGVTVLSGSAEQTGLPDNSVSLIIAASCFEWFNHRQAATEWRRILVPDGRILLMWNHRVAIDSITRAWDRLWAHHMGPRLGRTSMTSTTCSFHGSLARVFTDSAGWSTTISTKPVCCGSLCRPAMRHGPLNIGGDRPSWRR